MDQVGDQCKRAKATSLQNQWEAARLARAERYHRQQSGTQANKDFDEYELWAIVFTFIENTNTGFTSLVRWRLVSKRFHDMIEYNPSLWNGRGLVLDGRHLERYALSPIGKAYCDMFYTKGYNLTNLTIKGADNMESKSWPSTQHFFGINFVDCIIPSWIIKIIGQQCQDTQIVNCKLTNDFQWLNSHDADTKAKKADQRVTSSTAPRLVVDCGKSNRLVCLRLCNWFPTGLHVVIKSDFDSFVEGEVVPYSAAYVYYLTIISPVKKFEYDDIKVTFPGLKHVYIDDQEERLSGMKNTGPRVFQRNRHIDLVDRSQEYKDEVQRQYAAISAFKAFLYCLSPDKRQWWSVRLMERERLLRTTQNLGSYSLTRLRVDKEGLFEQIEYQSRATKNTTGVRGEYLNGMRKIVCAHFAMSRDSKQPRAWDHLYLLRKIDQLLDGTPSEWQAVEKQVRQMKKQMDSVGT